MESLQPLPELGVHFAALSLTKWPPVRAVVKGVAAAALAEEPLNS